MDVHPDKHSITNENSERIPNLEELRSDVLPSLSVSAQKHPDESSSTNKNNKQIVSPEELGSADASASLSLSTRTHTDKSNAANENNKQIVGPEESKSVDALASLSLSMRKHTDESSIVNENNKHITNLEEPRSGDAPTSSSLSMRMHPGESNSASGNNQQIRPEVRALNKSVKTSVSNTDNTSAFNTIVNFSSPVNDPELLVGGSSTDWHANPNDVENPAVTQISNQDVTLPIEDGTSSSISRTRYGNTTINHEFSEKTSLSMSTRQEILTSTEFKHLHEQSVEDTSSYGSIVTTHSLSNTEVKHTSLLQTTKSVTEIDSDSQSTELLVNAASTHSFQSNKLTLSGSSSQVTMTNIEQTAQVDMRASSNVSAISNNDVELDDDNNNHAKADNMVSQTDNPAISAKVERSSSVTTGSIPNLADPVISDSSSDEENYSRKNRYSQDIDSMAKSFMNTVFK